VRWPKGRRQESSGKKEEKRTEATATAVAKYVTLLASVKAYFLLLIAIYSFRQND